MEEKKKLLLVEGKNDKFVLTKLLEKFKIGGVCEIIDTDGISNLLPSIPVHIKASDVGIVGIIIDADTNLNNRWTSIKDRLLKQEFQVPKDLPKDGLILSNGNIKVGVWIMPNNNINGMLEDFIAFLIPQNDELLPIVDSTLADIESKQLNKYAPIHKSKARIHSWLAYQEEPGASIGVSITRKYLTTDNENCEQLIAWLTKLFVE